MTSIEQDTPANLFQIKQANELKTEKDSYDVMHA